ncbi:MAG TPA: ABC transporter permease [Verrucomicrobiae bacterium]|nr:ABC transporter permease [Verrucomicrobiae bacterium]
MLAQTLFSNIRFAYRQMAKSPGFTAVALFTLALGIAGNVVIFSVFNGLYLRPLPFKEPGRLLNLDEVAPKWNLEYTGVAYDDFDAWRRDNQTFEAMGVWTDGSFNFARQGNAERVEGGSLSHGMLATLAIQPVAGRGFLKEEDQPGEAQVVMLGYRFWKRQWGGDSNVIGQTISVDAVPRTVVGVLPPDIGPLARTDIFVPLALAPGNESGWFLEGVGRLRPGVTLEAARQDLIRIHKAQIPKRPVNEITTPRLTPLRERILGDYRAATYVLMAAVGMVWLIACANVAGLMLARGLTRAREISIRLALGATSGAVVWQVLVESLALSALGGAIGIFLGQSCLQAMVRAMPDRFPEWISFAVDNRFALFCLATTFLTAAIFGLIPALKIVSSSSAQGALQAASRRATGSISQRRSLNTLVIGEMALALVMLINAGLLIKAFQAVQRVDPGFRAENVLTYRVSLPEAKYTNAMVPSFFREHLARVRALPGVKAASAASLVPLEGHSGTFFQIENAPPKGKDEPDPVVLIQRTFPDYAEAMGLKMVAGRYLAETEMTRDGAHAAVVNETFAKSAWPKQDPIGKRIKYPGDKSALPWITIIGVARDVRQYGFDKMVRPAVYQPYAYDAQREMILIVRGENDPRALLGSIREVVKSQDPELPMFQIRTMSDRVTSSLWLRRSYSWLFGFFAAVALTLCLGGIYGVISYTVGQRTGEIGIRLALGARQWDVQRMVLAHWMRLAGVGIALGLMAALGVTRAMRSLLADVSPNDVTIYAVVTVLLAGVSLLACVNPARRAANVDPMESLRCE